MPNSPLKETPHDTVVAAVIGVCIGLVTVYVAAHIVAAGVWVYGFIPDLISPIAHQLK